MAPPRRSVFGSLLLSTLALAQNPAPYTVPANGEIGTVRIPIACHVQGYPDTVLDSVFTGTFPIFAQSGQQLYLSDITAYLTVPHSLTSKFNLVNGDTLNNKVQTQLQFTQGSPSPLQVFPNGLWVNGTAVNAAGDTVVKVPSSGVLPPIGPITAGAANQTLQIYLGEIDSTVYAYDSTGKQKAGPIAITCPAPNPTALLSLVNIQPASNGTQPALQPSLGYRPTFPTQPEGKEYGFFNFSLSCQIGLFGPFYFPLVAGGSAYGLQKPGAQFSAENLTAYLTVSQDAINTLHAIYPNASALNTTVQSFYVGATNAQPAALNGLKSPYSVYTKLPKSGDVTIDIPQPGQQLTVGPFTAGSTVGQRMFVSVGNSTSISEVYDDSGNHLGELYIFCNPISAVQLIGILISNTGLPTYTS